jgi:uncharacterized membrane protein YsdA (DUF1294 family)/cold shock CspA family protein
LLLFRPVRFKGTISDWNDERGFGFIQPAEGGARVFLHIKAVRDRAVRPVNGKRVTYQLGRDDRGRPRAENVRDSLLSSTPAKQPGTKPHPVLAAITSALFLTGVAVLALTGHLTANVAICYWAVSVIAFCMYWPDKWAAEHDARRTPESTLQLLALACGWPGAWVAQQLFRHKTRKASFQTVFWFCVGLNCAALVVLLALGGDPVAAFSSALEQ